MRQLLQHADVPVRRFPAVQFLRCCGARGERSRCFSDWCVTRQLPNRSAWQCASKSEYCMTHGKPSRSAARPVRGKYPVEVRSSSLYLPLRTPHLRLHTRHVLQVERAIYNTLALWLPTARHEIDAPSANSSSNATGGDLKVAVSLHAYRSRLSRWRRVLGLPAVTRWTRPSPDVNFVWDY